MRAFTPSRRGGPALLVAGVLLAAAAPAAALAADTTDPDPRRKAEARAHLKRGAELIDAEDLHGALGEFEAAYRLVPSPTILHNFGIVYEGLGRKAAALEAFERFLLEADAGKASPAARAHAQQAIETLRAQVAEVWVAADVAGAAIFVDARRVGETPQERPIYLDAGPHHLSVEKAGLPAAHTQRVDVSAGQRVTVAVRLIAPPPAPVVEMTDAMPATETPAPAPAPPRDEPRRWQATAAWATAGAATFAAGAFATTLILRHLRFTEFNDKGCGRDNPALYHPDCQPLLDGGNNATKWAKVSGVATGLLGVGALLLYLTIPEAPVGVAAHASASQLGLGLQGRF